jgi:hypothetical protein
MNDSGKKTGGIAILFAGVSVIWQTVLFMWFFATLYRKLPLLGTYNRVWFFTAVDVSGWFRIMMLVYSCGCCLLLPFQVVSYLKLGARRFSAWTEGKESEGGLGDDAQLSLDRPTEGRQLWIKWSRSARKVSIVFTNLQNNFVFRNIRELNYRFWRKLLGINEGTTESERDKLLTKYGRIMRIAWCFLGFSILVLTIAGVEKIISFNDLSPQNDLSRPGQTIPFVLGIITFIEGASSACMPKPVEDSVEGDNHTMSDSPRGSVIEFRTVGLEAVFPDKPGSIGGKEE